jgi:hypothetical protein
MLLGPLAPGHRFGQFIVIRMRRNMNLEWHVRVRFSRHLGSCVVEVRISGELPDLQSAIVKYGVVFCCAPGVSQDKSADLTAILLLDAIM